MEAPPAEEHDAFIRHIEEHGYRDTLGPQLQYPVGQADNSPPEEALLGFNPFG